jgi:hypothetical protein
VAVDPGAALNMAAGLVMYDSIVISQIPGGASYAAGYLDGRWPTWGALKQAFPHAHLLSIAVGAAVDADCLDVETGDATVSQAPNWVKRQIARGMYRPVVYAQASTMPVLLAALKAAGIKRQAVRLWSAHYGAGQHICGPATCDYPGIPACDGTQWTPNALGLDLDESLLLGDFFAPRPKSTPRRHEPVQLPQNLGYTPVSIPAGVKHVLLSVGANTSRLRYQFLPGGTWQALTLVAQDGAAAVAVPTKANQFRVQRSETVESIDVALQDS